MTASHPEPDSSQNLRDTPAETERARVHVEVADTLRARGVELTGTESDDQLATLLSALERFESAVEARGGDRMVNDRTRSEQENPSFVVPGRSADESVDGYTQRLMRAAERLMNRDD